MPAKTGSEIIAEFNARIAEKYDLKPLTDSDFAPVWIENGVEVGAYTTLGAFYFEKRLPTIEVNRAVPIYLDRTGAIDHAAGDHPVVFKAKALLDPNNSSEKRPKSLRDVFVIMPDEFHDMCLRHSRVTSAHVTHVKVSPAGKDVFCFADGLGGDTFTLGVDPHEGIR